MTRQRTLPLLPMAVTFAALACGFASLEATRAGAWDIALRLITLAAVADGIDGTIARRLHVAGQMGQELDALSDVVSFGAAPAFLLFARYRDTVDPLWSPAVLVPAVIFLCAGAYRLARFRVESRPDTFSGLPITVAGVLLAAAVAGPVSPSAAAAVVVAFVLAVLMVSRVPFPTFARWRWTLLAVMGASVVPIVIWPRGNTVAIVAIGLLGMYVLWGVIARVIDDHDIAVAEGVLDVS